MSTADRQWQAKRYSSAKKESRGHRQKNKNEKSNPGPLRLRLKELPSIQLLTFQQGEGNGCISQIVSCLCCNGPLTGIRFSLWAGAGRKLDDVRRQFWRATSR